jgi:hypothetical protein
VLSIKIMSWVWDHSPYEGKALLLHLALADFANDAGECWPSQPTLAAKARCTERHVRDTVSQMVNDGYVQITNPSNGVTSHRYLLVARNSVPPRKSKTGRAEIQDRERGNPSPENRQEPSENPKCPYCKKRYNPSKPHSCSAMNMLMR